MATETGSLRLSIPEALVALPAFHIFAASLFLIGYHAAFGYNIAVFAGPGDLFSVTMRELASTYIFSMGMPIIYTLWARARYGGWTRAEAIDKAEDPDRRAQAREQLDKDRVFFAKIIAAMLLAQIVLIALVLYRDSYVPYPLIHLFAVVLFMLAVVWFANRLQMDALLFTIIYLIGILMITAGFSGLSQGQRDRRATFASIRAEVPRCGQFAVLRSLSSMYLAVHSSSRHVIIDTDCRPKFLLGG